MNRVVPCPRPAASAAFAGFALASLLAFFSGCNVVPPAQTDPTRYYVLSDAVSERHAVGSALAAARAAARAKSGAGPSSESTAPSALSPSDSAASTPVVAAESPAPASVPSATGGALRIGLQPIRLAAYLRGLPMVVRGGANEIAFKEYQRWAEPLDGEIAQELRAHLIETAGIGRVFVPPLPLDDRRDYDVSVAIIRCEGAERSEGKFDASFAAIIEISTPGLSGRLVARKLYVAPDADWNGRDFGQLARLLSDDVAALAGEIASVLPLRP